MGHKSNSGDWRALRIGDWIRFVRIPTEFGILAAETILAREEVVLYEKLILHRRRARVSEIDKDGRPWIRARFRRPDRGFDIHFLAVDDNSWIRVKPRRK